MHEDHEVNRASWEELAAAHGQDGYYDSEALIAGESSLIEEEEAALLIAVDGNVSGKRVLHVQCHLGFDAITFARRGAQVTGVDFSEVALNKARTLAERCGVEVEWICADVTDLPEALDGRFDLAWATIGILCWIADLPGWMRSVARTLKRGGRLVLIDGHPLDETVGKGPVEASRRMPYEEGQDYATPLRTGPQVQFIYSLNEIVAAASAARLRVEVLKEHTDVSHDFCNDRLERESDNRYRRRVDGQPWPVLLTLVASRWVSRPPKDEGVGGT